MPVSVKRIPVNISPVQAEIPVEISEAAEVLVNEDPDAAAKKTEEVVADVEGRNYHVPVYYIIVFYKEVPVVLFYMSKGITEALDEMQVSNVIQPLDSYPENPDPDCIYFKISGKCYLEVLEWAFQKYPYVQSVVGGIMTVATNRTTVPQLEDGNQWIKRIVNPPNLDKGKDTLKFFNRLLDDTTTRVLKLYQYHKKNIYTLLRWICQEYNTLRLKDNLSLENKRLRCNETAASLLTMEFSYRLNRLISLGDKATIENYKELFKWPGDLLITKLFQSGLLSFDDSVNDMNFFKKFKFTTKGPQSLGNKNGNNVGSRYRSIHPSFIGNIDVLVCGNSDPGRNGLLSPWGNIKGLYFNDSAEVGDFLYNLQEDLKAYYDKKGTPFICLQFDNPEDYYAMMYELQQENDNMKCYGTSREGHMEIIVDTEDYFNDDDTSDKEKK